MANWAISPGDWCHIDVPSGDREKSKRFYGDVFGWRFEDYPGAPYVGVKTSEDGIESGLGTLTDAVELAATTPGPVPYIRPADFDTTLDAITKSGGEVLIPKTDVLGYGWFAHFRDPDGNVIGLWEDAEPHS